MCIAAHGAMAVRRPIFATGVGRLRNSVASDVNGRLAPLGSAEAVADAIADLAPSPARLAASGEAGAAWMVALYGADRVYRGSQTALARVDALHLGACLVSRSGRKRSGNERAGA